MSQTKRFMARRDADSAPSAPDVDPTKCASWGCPLRGSVDPGSAGKFFCHCHAYATPEQWQAITRGIREHDWLLGLMADLRDDKLRKTWRDYAAKFWEPAEPDVMTPHKDETRDLYLYRLHLEFEHRVGARTTRPGPQLPQGLTWPKRQAGNIGAAIAEAVTA